MDQQTLNSKKDVQPASNADQVSADKTQKIKELVEELLKNDVDQSGLPELLALTNTPEYNRLKLCEELTELTEVLLKYNNKKASNKPKDSAIIDEIGDVIIRLFVLIFQDNIQDEVGNRVEAKCKKLFKYFLEGKYTGGI